MCNCFNERLNFLKERLLKELPEHTELKVDWQNRFFFFGENPPKIPVVIPIEYSYRKVKVSGEPYRNKERNRTNAVMNFCPFCGEDLRREE